MDKNLLRAQLLMEAADLLDEESYEELDESNYKPNTNERYALAKGYVNKDELIRRDHAKSYGKDPRKYAPGVTSAKREMEHNRYSYFLPNDDASKFKDSGIENTRKRWLKLHHSKALERAEEILENRKKDYYEYPHNDDTKKALRDRWDAANEKFNTITVSHMENYGWTPKYNNPKSGTYRKLEDFPEAHWKKYIEAEGKDPWRQYPKK